MALVLVNGALEYVQDVVRRCNEEYEAIRHRGAVGLLRTLNETFELAEHPRRLSVGRMRTSSSAEIGAFVHRQIERAAAGEKVVDPHPFTRAFADYIARQGWTVIACEVPLVAAESLLYTRIDLLLYELATNTPVLIELKTGRDTCYRARLVTNRAHIGLPVDVHDSYHTRTHLQLAWMYWTLMRRFALPRLQAFVLTANTRGVKREPLARWARTYARLIGDKVAAHRATQLAGTSISSGQLHN